MKQIRLLLVLTLCVVILTGCLGGVSKKSYVMTGKVVDEKGNEIEGVTLAIEGDSTTTAITDSNGNWTVTVSGTCTVSPSKSEYGFSPKTITVTEKNAKNISIRGVTGKIVGRVVNKGEALQTTIQVIIQTDSSNDDFLETDLSGYFEIPLERYNNLDSIRVSVDSPESLEEEGLLRWFNFDRVPTKPGFLPDADLNGYGLRLISPQYPDRIDDYPYEGQISEYNRGLEVTYRLYFFDTLDNFLGYSAANFSGNSFSFDGRLNDGSLLDQCAWWCLAGFLKQDGLAISVNSPGNAGHFGTNEWPSL